MSPQRTLTIVLPLVVVLAIAAPGRAQIAPTPAPSAPGAPAQAPPTPQATLQPSSSSTIGGATTVTSPAATGTTSTSATITAPVSTLSFGTVGRGLPGMASGPPVNGGMGAQFPSSYMSPQSFGPLFCDPAINIPCY